MCLQIYRRHFCGHRSDISLMQRCGHANDIELMKVAYPRLSMQKLYDSFKARIDYDILKCSQCSIEQEEEIQTTCKRCWSPEEEIIAATASFQLSGGRK